MSNSSETNNIPDPSGMLGKQIQIILNRACAENGSDTPDFILAMYLTDCLAAFDKATNIREKWYGRGPRWNENITINEKN